MPRWRFAGVIDLTLHELIDEIAGGQHAAGPDRLEAASRMGIPQVVVPGSTHYIVTWRFADLKKSFRQRTTMMHNPEMTFVMPSEREMAKLGEMVARKLNLSRGNTVMMVPLKGFCYPNCEGRPLYNPKGVQAFVAALEKRVKPSIPVRLLPLHVNDDAFADAVLEEFDELTRACRLPEAPKPKEFPMQFKGKIIDLSQEIYQGMPADPGHLKTVIWTHASHEEVGRAIGTGFSMSRRD